MRSEEWGKNGFPLKACGNDNCQNVNRKSKGKMRKIGVFGTINISGVEEVEGD